MKRKESKPSFFKVLIGDFSKKLRIPPAFVKNLNGSSLGKIILESPGGEDWIIKMKKDVNGLWFEVGWQEFVKGHSLEVGDFLVFKYHGNSKFSVKIFGKTSCEKVKVLVKMKNDQPTIRTNNGNKNQARDEIQECKPEDCAMYCNENAHLRSGKKLVIIEKNENQIQARVRTQDCKPKNCEADYEDEAIYPGRNPQNSRSGKKHVIKGVDKPPTRSAFSFKSENSCFILTFTDSSKYQLTIPRRFAREKNLKTNKMVKLKDPSGRSWKVKLYIGSLGGRVYLKQGWSDFCRGNRLASNNILIFEYMQPSVMRVHIFREEGSRRTLKSQMFNAAKAIKIEAE